MYCEKYVEMGRKIRYYRIMQELGQGMLAEQIGITPQYLSKIEHGSARPSMDLVFRIADKLQVKVSHLLEACLYFKPGMDFSSFLWYNTHVIASARGN